MLPVMLNTTLFSGMAEGKVKEIAAFSELVMYRQGTHPISEGESLQHLDLLLLVEGEVDVETRFSPLPNAMEFNLHAISNEMFGEVAWILGGKRTASVKCKTDCKFIQINGTKLYEYCQAHPAVGVALITRIAAVMAQRVVHLSEQLKNKALFS